MIYKIYKKNTSKLIDMDEGIIHTIHFNKVACGLDVNLSDLCQCKSIKSFGDKRKHCEECHQVIYGY